MNTIRIDGITYQVIRERNFTHDGKQRTALRLRRPNGSKQYEAVRYENGSVSSVVTCPFTSFT